MNSTPQTTTLPTPGNLNTSITTQNGIGDINSTAKGSGARFNSGKPPLDLIPLKLLADYYRYQGLAKDATSADAIEALWHLGDFQERNPAGLSEALAALGDGWNECAHVFDFGRRKYAAWNWSKGMPWSVPLACAARHLVAIIRGEDLDPDSGLPHRGHVFCNIVMLQTYATTYQEGDDRPAEGTLS